MCYLADWDEALVQFWKRAQQEVGPLTYGQVRDQSDPGAPSCGLQVALPVVLPCDDTRAVIYTHAHTVAGKTG